MAHGFDEEGRKYDEKGNYKPWWVSIDIEMYKEKTKNLIEVFNKEKYHGLSINGELTLGENLADFASAPTMPASRRCPLSRRTSGRWRRNGSGACCSGSPTSRPVPPPPATRSSCLTCGTDALIDAGP